MKKVYIGFIVGLIIGLLFSVSALSFASNQRIRLIVNGQEIQTDVPPQLIDGRVMVPARFVAEPLGATVKWDEKNKAVVITKNFTDNTTIESSIPSGYYTGRQIFEAFSKKYPNMRSVGGIGVKENGDLIREFADNEFAFGSDGVFWFGKTKFILPYIQIQERIYFSIEPLSKANILSPSDF